MNITEMAILSGIAQFGKAGLNEIIDIIESKSFSDTNNQILFKVLIEATNQNDKLDIPTILSYAKKLCLDDKISVDQIKELYNTNIEFDNLRNLSRIVKRLEIIKEYEIAIRNTAGLIKTLTGHESLNDIITKIENPILHVQNSIKNIDDAPQKLFEQAVEFLNYKEQNNSDIAGIPTGYMYYDNIIGGGLRPGEINIICARPKSGKSVFAKEVAINIANINIPVLLLDTEMDKDSQLTRALASLTLTDQKSIETGSFNKKRAILHTTALQMQHKPLFYKRIAGKKIEEILTIIRRWLYHEVGRGKPSVIIYDYFKLMNPADLGKMGENQALGFQLTELTNFLGDYGASCLSFVQANRDGISKETTDIVAQSDRITWFCSSLALLRKKTKEEIALEGINNGNRKLIPMDGMRHSSASEDGGYINLNLDGSCASLTELSYENT